MKKNGPTQERRGAESQGLLVQHIRALSAEVAELKEAGGEALTDTLAHWLAAQYVVAAKTALREASGTEIEFKTLRDLSADVVALRRGDHSAERLRIDRERLELDREQSKERTEKLFWEWAQKPENKSRICDRGLSTEEKAARIREIFGMARTPPPRAEASAPREAVPSAGLSKEGLTTIEEAFHIL